MFLHLWGMSNFWLFLLEFLIGAALVLVAGGKLSVYGDVIAERSKFSHGWIGFILMASITSLPELMTGISSTALLGSADLLMGDTVGSNAVNIVILAGMFFIAGKSFEIKIEELMTAFVGLVLLGLTAVFVMAGKNVHFAWQSLFFSLTLLAVYFYLVFLAFKTGGLKEEEEIHPEENDKNIYLKFVFFALVIVFAAIWMTQTADFLAKTPFQIGNRNFILGQTFVGALFLSIATSLPELAVTFGAVRLGNISMAVGNIFGSNVFNLFIIPVSAFFFKGIFWNSVSASNMTLIVVTLLVTALIGVDLAVRSKLKTRGGSVLNVLILLVWIIGMATIFIGRNAIG